MLYYYRNELTGETTWEQPPPSAWKLVARAPDEIVPGTRGPGKGGGRDGVGAWKPGDPEPADGRTEEEKAVDEAVWAAHAMSSSSSSGHPSFRSTSKSEEPEIVDEDEAPERRRQSKAKAATETFSEESDGGGGSGKEGYAGNHDDHDDHHEEEHSELEHVAAAGLPTHYYYDQSTGRTTWERPSETAWVKVPVEASRRKPILDIITAIVMDVMGMTPPPSIAHQHRRGEEGGGRGGGGGGGGGDGDDGGGGAEP